MTVSGMEEMYLDAPVIRLARKSEKNTTGESWLVRVEGNGREGAQIQIKTADGGWMPHAEVDGQGIFAFTTGYFENDGVTVRQVYDGQTSPESEKVPIQVGAILSVRKIKTGPLLVHVEFSDNVYNNWVGLFDRGANPDDTPALQFEQCPTSPVYFEFSAVSPGQYMVGAFANNSRDPVASVNIDV
ncbi:hypothetical protein KXR64_20960 [Brucella intermedia]|uniref:hypothetical protein n=1 Tax=Brucella TaxID=234 RepID=UPI000946668F|nr:hypothetical protein [Brucella intermedia]